jgi:hypothetical protein
MPPATAICTPAFCALYQRPNPIFSLQAYRASTVASTIAVLHNNSAAAARAWRRAADQRDRPPLPAGAGRNGVSRLNVVTPGRAGGSGRTAPSGRPQPSPVARGRRGSPDRGLAAACQRG